MPQQQARSAPGRVSKSYRREGSLELAKSLEVESLKAQHETQGAWGVISCRNVTSVQCFYCSFKREAAITSGSEGLARK